MTSARPRFALCLFGIPRSARLTQASIRENLLAPLRAVGDVTVYAHFFRQETIANPRSGEFGVLDPEEHRFLPIDHLTLTEADDPQVAALYDSVVPYGAAWNGDFASLQNLCKQLVSLRHVTRMALADGHDKVIFARPDLLYHDSLGQELPAALEVPTPALFTPCWQESSGLNDRFSLAFGEAAIRAYGMRADQALAWCAEHDAPLPAEVFLKWAARDVARHPIRTRASRVRFDGSQRAESFDFPEVAAAVQRIRQRIRQPGLRSLAISLVRLRQALRHGPRYTGLRRLPADDTAAPASALPVSDRVQRETP